MRKGRVGQQAESVWQGAAYPAMQAEHRRRINRLPDAEGCCDDEDWCAGLRIARAPARASAAAMDNGTVSAHRFRCSCSRTPFAGGRIPAGLVAAVHRAGRVFSTWRRSAPALPLECGGVVCQDGCCGVAPALENLCASSRTGANWGLTRSDGRNMDACREGAPQVDGRRQLSCPPPGQPNCRQPGRSRSSDG